MIIKSSNRIHSIRAYYFATKLAEIAGLDKSGKNIINLGIGSPDLLPPEEVIHTLRDEAIKKEANKYQSYRGLLALRTAFAQTYLTEFNTSIDPVNEVLPLLGSKEGIMHIAMSFLNPGSQVLVPNPGYPSYSITSQIAGADPIAYDLTEKNNWLPDLDELEKKDLSRVKIMWINYPHMPTGAIADLDFYKNLVQFAKRNKILICHDNPYNFILNKNPHSIFEVPDAKECCLELGSLSKCYNMAGWRVGALIGGKEYIDTVLRFKSNMDSGMYKPIQVAAIKALSNRREWTNQLNKTYADRRKKVWKILDLLDCTYSSESAGLFVWAKVPEYVGNVEEWVDEILYKAGVFITPGFVFGSNGKRYVRLSLCSEQSTLDEAFFRIEEYTVKSIVEI